VPEEEVAMRLFGCVRILVFVAVVLCLARPSRAEEEESQAQGKGILPIPDYSGDLFKRSWLSGDWGGKRTDWAERGFQVDVDWVQTVQGVAGGGRNSETEYGGSLDYLLFFDFYRMGLVPGAMLKVRGESRYGKSVNPDSGSVLPVSMDMFMPLTAPLDENIPITVTDLTYYQFLSEKFGILLGKIDTLDSDPNEFASGRGNTQFQNFNLIFNSTLALLPYSTLAAGAIGMPSKYVTITEVFFLTTDSSTTSGFSDFGHGWSSATEADFQYKLSDLPGGTNLGFVYSGDDEFFTFGKRFTFVPGEGLVPPTSKSTWSLYWSGWQYLHTEEEAKGPMNLLDGRPDLQGWGLFWRLGFADKDTNPVQWGLSVGLGGRGIIPKRDDDTFGVAYYYAGIVTTRISGIVGIDDHFQGFEFFYDLAVTPAAQLTFDVQLTDPAAPGINTTVILGLRLYLRF
jgi:porin